MRCLWLLDLADGVGKFVECLTLAWISAALAVVKNLSSGLLVGVDIEVFQYQLHKYCAAFYLVIRCNFALVEARKILITHAVFIWCISWGLCRPRCVELIQLCDYHLLCMGLVPVNVLRADREAQELRAQVLFCPIWLRLLSQLLLGVWCVGCSARVHVICSAYTDAAILAARALRKNVWLFILTQEEW